MDTTLKNKITQIQVRFVRAIKNHQICFEKLQNCDNDIHLTDELNKLKREVEECHEEQKTLLKQVSANVALGDGCKFNLYNIPTAPKKNRRRKDTIKPVKPEKKTREIKAKSPSPAASTDSDSDESDGFEEEFETWLQTSLQTSLPAPLPKPTSETTVLPISRMDIRASKFGRRVKAEKIQDDNPMKELPVIEDPPPSPEPVDEHEAKLKFMAALKLIPIENLNDLLTKKTERKRRSTANNQYLYNKDWEVPVTKRKQYLSPVKIKSPEQTKAGDKKKLISSQKPVEVENECEGPNMNKCKICSNLDTMVSCSDCNEMFHPKCTSIPELEQSFLLCRRCNRAQNPYKPEEPNKMSDIVALAQVGTDGVEAAKVNALQERYKLRTQLIKILRLRMIEKGQMERKVLQLVESIALQNRMKMNLVEEISETDRKIDTLKNFIINYQQKEVKPEIEAINEEEKSAEDASTPVVLDSSAPAPAPVSSPGGTSPPETSSLPNQSPVE